jgi:hypothetical protein
MHLNAPLGLTLVLPLLAACPLAPENIGDPAASEPNTDSTTSTAGPTTTAPDTSADTNNAPVDTVDTDAPVDPQCAGDMPGWQDHHVYPSVLPDMRDEACTLESSLAADDGFHVVLDCPLLEQDRGLDVFDINIVDGPLPALPPVGTPVDISLSTAEVDFDASSRTLVMRSQGKLLYASASALWPDAEFADQPVYAPLSLGRNDLCELATVDPGETDGFFCTGYGRTRIKLSAAGSPDLVLPDDTSGMITADGTTYAVHTRKAWRVADCYTGFIGDYTVAAFDIAAQ